MNFIKAAAIFATLLISTASAYAQKLNPIQLDRPDQTETPAIVPKGYIQAENGFLFENSTSDIETKTFPSALWKYGINERVELRIITEFASVKEKSTNKTITGLMPVTVGFKANICQEKGIIPHTSFIGHLTTANFGSSKLRTSYAAPSFRFLMAHNISDRFSISYNLGAEWDGENPEETYLYTFATGFSITDKLGMYTELFGFAPRNSKASHAFDGGFTYLVNNDIMLDISGGFGLTDNAIKNYVALGFSYRFRVCGAN